MQSNDLEFAFKENLFAGFFRAFGQPAEICTGVTWGSVCPRSNSHERDKSWCFCLQWIKKGERKTEGTKCHLKTMMSKKPDKTVKKNPTCVG